MASPSKRVLLTGAAGFVGANLVRRLCADGHQVRALVRPQTDCWRLRGLDGVEVIPAAIEDARQLKTLVCDFAPEWVFHLAAHGGYSWQTDFKRMVEAALFGTAALVESLQQADSMRVLVAAGSSSEYGYCESPPPESARLKPNSEYAVAKAAAGMYLEMRSGEIGRPVVLLRLYSVYGPWEEPNRFIPALVTAGLAGKLPPLVAPETARDFVYVDDVVDAFICSAALAEKRKNAAGGFSAFNIGSGKQTTIREAVAAAKSVMPIAEEPVWGSMSNRRWDTESWQADITAARSELGWEPRYGLLQGLTATAQWLSLDPAMLAFYQTRIASEKR